MEYPRGGAEVELSGIEVEFPAFRSGIAPRPPRDSGRAVPALVPGLPQALRPCAGRPLPNATPACAFVSHAGN